MSYQHPIVVVVWDDSQQHSDGAGRARHAPARLVRLGFLVEHDEHGVSVVSEYSNDDDSWRDEHFIPNSLIVSIEEVHLAEK